MTRPPVLVAAVMVGVLSSAIPGGAQPVARVARSGEVSILSLRTATLTSGRIEGVVTDDRGSPLSGVAISAFGPDALFTLSDPLGRFSFSAVPVGIYLLRAQLPGYAASLRGRIEVRPSTPVREVFQLAPLTGVAVTAQPRSLLTAGFGGNTTQPKAVEPSANDAEAETPDDSARAWRLRHTRRSVLRSAEGDVVVAGTSLDDPSWLVERASLLRRMPGASLGNTGLFANDASLSGQFRLLTASHFAGDGPFDWLTAENTPRGVAYGTLGAPIGQNGRWEVQGALTNGDISSWILAGAYTRAPSSGHALNLGASFSAQQYDEDTPAALLAIDEQSRSVGVVHAVDRWMLSRRAMFTYGARYAWHDYLDREGLLSPTAAFVFSPMADTWVRAAVSQQMLAPGAEEFEPRGMTSFVLPPQRTFAPLGADDNFSVERTRHIELGIEREVASFVVGVRRFEQAIDNQLVALFNSSDSPEPIDADLGHYRVANAGNLTAGGWAFSVARPVAGPVRGEVEYSVATAEWESVGDKALLLLWAPDAVRLAHERIHDVTATVATDVARTQTNVVAVYKINTAFTDRNVPDAAPGVAYRFDVQVTQHLPFLTTGHTRWEALVSVRNLFRESVPGASLYDELLVVGPPKRMVGGLLVRF
ncbi:MAG: TonB-dependent receptor [Luteitalea sp.]|nr:TonB-dependent receptor [Luteitalea sp.]